MARVLFLNIDGVLNSNFWNDNHQREISDGTLIDEELTKMISEMITALNNGEFEDEAAMDYFMEKLEAETGLTEKMP